MRTPRHVRKFRHDREFALSAQHGYHAAKRLNLAGQKHLCNHAIIRTSAIRPHRFLPHPALPTDEPVLETALGSVWDLILVAEVNSEPSCYPRALRQ